jgi:hypothetical protein
MKMGIAIVTFVLIWALVAGYAFYRQEILLTQRVSAVEQRLYDVDSLPKTIVRAPAPPCVLAVDLDGIDIDVTYDPKRNAFVCSGASNAEEVLLLVLVCLQEGNDPNEHIMSAEIVFEKENQQ